MRIAEARGVSFAWPGSVEPVFSGLDLAIESGEITCLVGPNGSGKTTLARLLAGDLVPSAGTIERHFGDQIAFRYQDFDENLLPWYSAKRNLHLAGIETREASTDLSKWLAVGDYSDWCERSVRRLSGGQRQLLSLVSVLLLPAKFLVFDEPFSAIDPGKAPRLWQLMRRFVQDRGLGALAISHSLDESIGLSDRVALLGRCGSGIVQKIEIQREVEGPSFLKSRAFRHLRHDIATRLYGLA